MRQTKTMSYRDPEAALRLRRENLAFELAEARRSAADARAHEARVALLERQLAETDALLEKAAGRAPNLDEIRVASPCNARWEDMAGDAQVRFCGQCSKNVYDLSALSRSEAESLLREREGEICARFYRRSDGTVLTDNCPVGERRVRRRLQVLSIAGGSMLAVTALVAGAAPEATMGAVPCPIGADAPETSAAKAAMPKSKPPEPVRPITDYVWHPVGPAGGPPATPSTSEPTPRPPMHQGDKKPVRPTYQPTYETMGLVVMPQAFTR